MNKDCTICKETKPIEEFYYHKCTNSYCSECKECTKKRSKKYREEQPEKIKQMRQNYKERRKDIRYETDRRAHLKRKYKITEEDYKQMYEQQKGCCAICQKQIEFRKLCVDHSHETNKVRGLLCKSCNLAIGSFKDDILLLENAINYLRRYENEK